MPDILTAKKMTLMLSAGLSFYYDLIHRKLSLGWVLEYHFFSNLSSPRLNEPQYNKLRYFMIIFFLNLLVLLHKIQNRTVPDFLP